jgi:hypothetical protein
MPPLGACAESHEERPDEDVGVKQILWSPDSWAVKVNRPEEEPRWETTRWSLSKTSYRVAVSSCFVIEREDLWDTYIYRDVDCDAVVLLPRLHPVVVLLGRVVAHDERVLGQLLEEAFGR